VDILILLPSAEPVLEKFSYCKSGNELSINMTSRGISVVELHKVNARQKRGLIVAIFFLRIPPLPALNNASYQSFATPSVGVVGGYPSPPEYLDWTKAFLR
jgi:hypothetical protein